jgi:hypothetical protein
MGAKANKLVRAIRQGRWGMGNLALRSFGAVIRRDGVNDAESNFVASEGHRELVGQDMLLRFEVWGLKSENPGQGRWRRLSLKGGVRLQKLGQSGGGKRVLGGDIE